MNAKKTTATKKEMQQVINFRSSWNEIKHEQNTINANLVTLFEIAKNPLNANFAMIFNVLCGSDFVTKSNKEINKLLYNIVQEKYPAVGKEYTHIKMIKGTKTEVTERKKISLYHTYLAIFQAAKKQLKNSEA